MELAPLGTRKIKGNSELVTWTQIFSSKELQIFHSMVYID